MSNHAALETVGPSEPDRLVGRPRADLTSPRPDESLGGGLHALREGVPQQYADTGNTIMRGDLSY